VINFAHFQTFPKSLKIPEEGKKLQSGEKIAFMKLRAPVIFVGYLYQRYHGAGVPVWMIAFVP